jgi:hypothetical protein
VSNILSQTIIFECEIQSDFSVHQVICYEKSFSKTFVRKSYNLIVEKKVYSQTIARKSYSLIIEQNHIDNCAKVM